MELVDWRSVRRHYDHICASSLSEAEIVVQRDVIPRQQATWSDSLSLGSEQELTQAVPAQEPILAPEQEQPEPGNRGTASDRPTSRRSRSTSAKEIY